MPISQVVGVIYGRLRVYCGVYDLCLSCDQVSTKSCVDCGLTSATSWSIWVSNVRSTEKAFPNSNVFGEAPSGWIVEYPFFSAQYPGPIFYVSHVEQDVSYVVVHFLVRSSDYAIFFLGVRYRSMVCDTRLLEEVSQ